MDALDISDQLAELRARVDHLLDRIAANSRLTAAAGLGTLGPTALPSGSALQLALGPMDLLAGHHAAGPHPQIRGCAPHGATTCRLASTRSHATLKELLPGVATVRR